MKVIRRRHPRVTAPDGVREHPMEVASATTGQKRSAKAGALTHMRNQARKDGHKVVGNIVHKRDGSKVNLSQYTTDKVLRNSRLRGV